MRNQEIFVSLDIGTTSIKVVVAEYINGRVNIIGVGNEKSRGLSRGVIVDIDETVYSIQRAIAQAEQKANVKINEVVVGIPSNQLQIEDCHGMIAVASENREITSRDVDNVISAAKVRSVPPEREIISIIPDEFIVDGFNGIRDPRGMIGVRLELYAHLITGPKTIIHNIKRCVQKSGLKINEMILQPQAIAAVALSQDEREFGTVVIDMGGGQTSASILYDNQLRYSFVDQEGGDFVTKDISVILNTSLDNAERIKREYGYAIASQTSEDEYFPVETVGKKEPVRVDEYYLAEIIEARLAQIFETIYEDLERVDALDLPGGFVLTGGGSALPGVLDLAKRYFGSRVRLYVPEEMGMRNPIYTTSMGLINYVSELDDIHRIAHGTYRMKMPQTSQPSMDYRQDVQYRQQETPRQRPDYYQDDYYPPRDVPDNNQGPTPESYRPSRPARDESDYDAYEAYNQSFEEEDYYETYSDQEAPRETEASGGNLTDKIRSFFQSFYE
ncbi:cell division protein FtsA [Suicoccus acidiformans]|uniref:Cell division protein FtsA n=1 Tax=Suicoccus acidiformans TaxID=2036206 RepID=A0A347WLL2_9LACT|nr:cell division protein FtsA [Suicoccus acidiformans]AXY25969.1 cell division protein FtsA [Suicoccus acidiformans]